MHAYIHEYMIFIYTCEKECTQVPYTWKVLSPDDIYLIVLKAKYDECWVLGMWKVLEHAIHMQKAVRRWRLRAQVAIKK